MPSAAVMAADPFLFGKLPAHGDFVSRGLSADDQARWDAWASAGLDEARETLGEDFEAAHDAAPPWRFLCASPEGGWRAGALACSIDSAGRRFVLVLGVDGLTPAEAAARGLRTVEALETVLYDALAQASPADATLDAVGLAAGALDATDEAALDALSPSLGGSGAWWTLGAEHSPPDLVVAADPPPGLFLRILKKSLQLEMAT